MSRWHAFRAGIVAAAVGIIAGELFAGVWLRRVTPLAALGDFVIDVSPGWLLIQSISLVQHWSKPLLIASVIGVLLATGGLLGLIARRSVAVALAGWSSGVLLVLLSHLRSGQTEAGEAVIVVAMAGVPAILVFAWLTTSTGRSNGGQHDCDDDPEIQQPKRQLINLIGQSILVLTIWGVVGSSYLVGRSSREVSIGPLPQPRSALPELPPEVRVAGPTVPPFFTPNLEFYRIDVSLVVPRVDVETWRLKVHGMVGRPLDISYRDLTSLPLSEIDATLSCVSNEVGGYLVGTARWTGVMLEDLLEAAVPDPMSSQVIGRAVDGWTAGFRTKYAIEVGAMVAVGMNGEILPPEHGFPARLIVPGLYGYTSATKWLEEIELTTWERFDAYWVERGWGKEGRVVSQSRIDEPGWGATLSAGRVSVHGVAWAPPVGVASVEVRVDDGEWRAAELGAEVNPFTWRQWKFDWKAQPGSHFIEARMIDAEGRHQIEDRRRPEPAGATGLHGVRVKVV